MAKLGQMSLMGVRSFGPESEDEQTIIFTSPLTLFLGQNGCGKTTIIECLKFACTDDLPGGGGKDFVNDPNLSGNVCTKGSIKLQIIGSNGDKVIICRVFNVEVRAKTTSFQRLDNTVVFKKMGQKNCNTISMKIPELMNIATTILGVSKPIINQVLFCHQEDSLWPLDSPKTVKETFDKIFEATKYNKAVDNIMKLVKQNKILLKTFTERKEGFRRDKAHVDRERLRFHEKQAKLEDLKKQVSDKVEELKPIETKLKDLSDLEDNLKELEKECSAKETEAQGVLRHIKEIRANLQEPYHGDDKSLKSDIDSFQESEIKWKQDVDNLTKSKEKLTQTDNSIEKQIRVAQDKIAQLKSAIDSNTTQVKERDLLVSKCETEFKLPHNSLDSKTDVLEAMSNLQDGYKGLETESHKYIKTLEEDELKQQKSVEVLFKNMISLDQEIDLKTVQATKANQEIVNLQNQLQDLKVSNKKMAQFEAEIARMTKDIDKISQTFKPDEAEKNIQNSKRDMKDLKTNLDSLEQEYDILRENHGPEKLLQNLECSVVLKQTEIQKIKNKHSAYFNEVFGDKTENCKDIVQDMQRLNSTKIATITQKITSIQRRVTEQETMCRSKKSKLQDMVQERNSSDIEIQAVCKGKPYPVVRKELEEQVETLQSDKGQYTSAKIVYNKFIKAFENEKPCCPICSTDFKNKKDAVIEIIQSLKGRIQSVPEDLKACNEKLKVAQGKFNRVVKLEATNKRVQELGDNIDSIKIELINIEETIDIEKRNLKQLQEDLKEPEKVKKMADNLLGDASLLDKSYHDLQSYEIERETLQNQLITINTTKSMEEIKMELSELKDNISRREHELDIEQRKLLQNRNKLQELKDRRGAENEKKLNMQKNMQGQPQLEKQYAKLQAEQEILTSEIAEKKLEHVSAKEVHDESSMEFDMVKATNKDEASNFRSNLAKQKRMLENIEDIQKKIKTFESENIEKLHLIAVDEGKQLHSRKAQLAEEFEKISKKKSDIEKKIAGQMHELRQLTDNLLLRQKITIMDKINREYDALKVKIAGQNYQKLLKDKQILNRKWHDLTNEIGKFKGQQQELQESIKELKAFLERSENKNAHKNYLIMCYKVVTLQKGNDDLVVFMRSIETSVLNFHTERMKQINKIARDLWRSIYQGNDIESIRIKTDNITSTSAVRRMYNYSVMQVKNGVEIEMRGRCSAGQKVLACLIIRMALAETFSLHCGILALDEPTTNLDRQNIMSLSDALVRLIEEREKNKNFQLLIITHDEEFLSALQRASSDTSYYHVFRNQKGFTRIEKKNLL